MKIRQTLGLEKSQRGQADLGRLRYTKNETIKLSSKYKSKELKDEE